MAKEFLREEEDTGMIFFFLISDCLISLCFVSGTVAAFFFLFSLCTLGREGWGEKSLLC